MPARNPRVNVVLEKPLYEAVEIREDIDLARFTKTREKTLRRSRAFSRKAIWG